MTEEIFNYVMKNFEADCRVDIGKFNINYGIDNSSKIQISKSNINYFNRREPLDLSVVVWKEWNSEKIPFLFNRRSDLNLITQSENNVIINFDIIASSFYFLTNWQEYVSNERDNYGRFRMTDSIQYKLDFLCLPVVNYYFDILKTAIEIAYNIKFVQNIWQGKKVAICLSHDIDLCKSAWIQGSFRELLKGNILTPFQLIASKLFAKDKWFNFSEIVAIEREFNANSTFFFLPFKGKKNGIPNADYNISKPEFRQVFKMLSESGSETAIHGSIGTSTDSGLLKNEIKKIGEEVIGNRFHFLMYDSFLSPSVLSESGLKYDSSLGFAEAIGFRNSYCLPFYLFDIKNNCSTDIIEIPLMVMDVSFGTKYIGLTQEEALNKMCDLLNEVEKFNGCFTLLWHNTYFSEYKYSGWKNVHYKFLEYGFGRGALMTGGGEIYNLFCSDL
jgi:hypothetical protein